MLYIVLNMPLLINQKILYHLQMHNVKQVLVDIDIETFFHTFKTKKSEIFTYLCRMFPI